MCGIYCFLSPNWELPACLQALNFIDDKLKFRGPNGFQDRELKVGNWTAKLAASILWLQGPQPALLLNCLNPHESILLWNGDVLKGPLHTYCSDTLNVSAAFSEDIFGALPDINGPYAFIFLDRKKEQFYFGRDRLGRHSLLWHFTDKGALTLTSVAKRDITGCNFKEVPSVGLFHIDLRKGDPKGLVTLYPWSDVSLEEAKRVQDSFPVGFIISDRKIQSPLRYVAPRTFLSPNHLENVSNLSSLMQDLQSSQMESYILELLELLKTSVKVRVETQQRFCRNCIEQVLHTQKNFDNGNCSSAKIEISEELHCSEGNSSSSEQVPGCVDTRSQPDDNVYADCDESSIVSTDIGKKIKRCSHSKTGILFSGGLDSTILAAIANEFVPKDEPIDLFNVAFLKQTKVVSKKTTHVIKEPDFNVPDRLSGIAAMQQLRTLFPERIWNFFMINVTQEELADFRKSVIADLIYPLNTVLDDSLGCALWFASRRHGLIQKEEHLEKYTSPVRVMLLGMGADELFGGYRRYRKALKLGGWNEVQKELDLELNRIPTRNLGRDNRVVASHGVAPRMPYLDEDVVSFACSLKPWERCYPTNDLPPGYGDKLLLRLVAWRLGLTTVAELPKRAMQFGSRIANKRENGADVSDRLCYRDVTTQ